MQNRNTFLRFKTFYIVNWRDLLEKITKGYTLKNNGSKLIAPYMPINHNNHHTETSPDFSVGFMLKFLSSDAPLVFSDLNTDSRFFQLNFLELG